MNIDFVFFDGQLWTYDEWAKIAPLSFFNDEKSLDDVKWFDPSGYNEQQKALLYSQYKGASFLVVRETNGDDYEAF